MKVTTNYRGIDSLLDDRDIVLEYYDNIYKSIDKAFYKVYLRADSQSFEITHIEIDDSFTEGEEDLPLVTVTVMCYTDMDGDFKFVFDFDASESVEYNAGYINAIIRMQLGDYE